MIVEGKVSVVTPFSIIMDWRPLLRQIQRKSVRRGKSRSRPRETKHRQKGNHQPRRPFPASNPPRSKIPKRNSVTLNQVNIALIAGFRRRRVSLDILGSMPVSPLPRFDFSLTVCGHSLQPHRRASRKWQSQGVSTGLKGATSCRACESQRYYPP